MRFSPSTLGWYPRFIDYPSLPTDLINVSEEVYKSLLGKRVTTDANGQPCEYVAPKVDIRDALFKKLADKRWQVQTSGIFIGGLQVETTDASLNRITQVVSNASFAGFTDETEVSFKGLNGFQRMTIGDVKSLAGLIAIHMQACFATEHFHHDVITALPKEDLQDYDINTGWPSSEATLT